MAKKKEDDLKCTIVTNRAVTVDGGEVVPAYTEIEAGDDGEISYAAALDCVGAGHAVFRKGSPVPSLQDPDRCDALLAKGKRRPAEEKKAAAN